MKSIEKKFLDIEYILERDEIIYFLFDKDLHYTLSDTKIIRKLLKTLLKYLKKGTR